MTLSNRVIGGALLGTFAIGLMIWLGTSLSFYQTHHAYQQRQLVWLAPLLKMDEQRKTNVDLSTWLTPALENSNINELKIYQGEQLVFHYPARSVESLALPVEPVQKLMLATDLSLEWRLGSPLQDPATLIHLAVIFVCWLIVVLLLGRGMMWWLRRQLHGVELLAVRGQLILQNRLYALDHALSDERPTSASQALTQLQEQQYQASKQRSDLDTFTRTNVFVDKKMGIGNRLFFENRLEASLSDPNLEMASLLLVELQDLDHINHDLGYQQGDALLLAASLHLEHALQRYADAISGRYTSNTFAILLPHVDEQEAKAAANYILKSLQRLPWPATVREPALFIGAVSFAFGELLHQVQEEAELALRSAALQNTNSGYFMYDKGASPDILGNGTVRWRTLLSRALEKDRLFLEPQTTYTVAHEPAMIELYARIEDEHGRKLSAANFMPKAEKCGLLATLEKAIVQRVLSQLQQPERSLPLSLNLSVASLLQSSFYQWLMFELLSLPKPLLSTLNIEFPEKEISCHYQQLAKPLHALKALGCLLTADHVGKTVVSSQYIKDFGVDYLKLDASLVRDIESKTINQIAVSSLIGSHVAGAKVIATGVETAAEWQCLVDLGIDGGQGYFFTS